jgi:hypothetical protein
VDKVGRITRNFEILLEIDEAWCRTVEKYRSLGLPGEHFLGEFRATWRALRLDVRRTLLGYWRGGNQPLLVSLVPLEDGFSAECCNLGRWLTFQPYHDLGLDLGLDSYPTRRAIAHELAHVYRYATIELGVLLDEPYSTGERETEKLQAAWGFPDKPRKRDRWTERYERQRDKIQEDVAAMRRLHEQGKTASPEYQRLHDKFLRDTEELRRLEGSNG